MSDTKEKLKALRDKVKGKVTTWVTNNRDQIGLIGTVLEKAGTFVPVFGSPVTAFGAALVHISDLAEKDAVAAEALQNQFDELASHMAIIADTLGKLTKETKDTSQVVNEMRILYVDIDKWAVLIKKGKPPENMFQSLKRKNDRLSKVLAAEVWVNVMKTARNVDILVGITKRETAEVYSEGKAYLVARDYVRANASFKEYRRLLEVKGTPVASDHSEGYLHIIWNELNKKAQEEQSRLLSYVPSASKNPYKAPSPSTSSIPATPITPGTPSSPLVQVVPSTPYSPPPRSSGFSPTPSRPMVSPSYSKPTPAPSKSKTFAMPPVVPSGGLKRPITPDADYRRAITPEPSPSPWMQTMKTG